MLKVVSNFEPLQFFKVSLFRRFAIFALLIALIAFSWRVPSYAASTITVNGGVTYQVIDGFGASDAFRIGSAIRGTSGSSLTSAQTQQIMDALFSTTTGAGLSIVRNEVGASTTGSSGDNQPSIEPNAPSGPNATPTYVWNSSDPSVDGDQLWFSQTAKSYGVNTFYADAWSAPQYMKTNNSLIGGGFLCGETGSGAPTCASGDWRQAYANYLTQYAKYYNQAGINLNYIGYINEPDFSASYVSMNFDTTQASSGNRGTLDPNMPQNIDFIKNYLGPTLKAAGLTTKVSCCEATSWQNAATYTAGILKDTTASSYLGLVTGHAYYANPNGLINTPITTSGQHVWETETSTFDTFTSVWDDNSDASGFQWGQNLWNAMVNAKANGFLYWWFAEVNSSNSDNEALININGSNFTIAKRLWAFGNYSRFVRPGAVRIDATTGDSNIKVSAYRNADGSYAIVVLNGNTASTPVSIALQNVTAGSAAVPYLTNATNDLAAQASVPVSGGSLSVTIPARSLVTYSIPAGGPTLTPSMTFTTGPTFTPSNTLPPSNTPTVTNTPTITNTPVPGLSVGIKSNGTDNNQQSSFAYQVKNTGSNALSGVSVRVYFTTDNGNAASNYTLEKYYDQSGVATISGPTLASGNTYYFTVSYGTAALPAGGSWEFQSAMHLANWGSNFDGSNDWFHTGYAVGALPAAYTSTTYLPGYLSGSLAWGSAPGGTVATNTPVPASNTPVPPTATFQPPTNTSIAPTNTTVPATNTPIPATNTPIPATNTPVPPTATPNGSTCSPVNATITAPFSFDGVGTLCWKSNNLGSYMNSWNAAKVTINGVDITSKYVASSAYPAKASDGYWYITYSSSVAWGHFEAK